MVQVSEHLLTEFIKHRERLWCFIFSIIKDYHLSEDTLQDVCLTILNSAEKYDPKRPFLPWALGIARYKSFEAVRKTEKQGSTLSNDIIQKLQESLVSLKRDDDQRLQALQHCMSQLSHENRQVMTMKYVNRFSVEKISELISRTRTATFSLLQRLRGSLATCITKKIKEEV